jgi:hypothetical protein
MQTMLDGPLPVVSSARALPAEAPANLIHGHVIAWVQAGLGQFERRGKPSWTAADYDYLLRSFAPHETSCPKAAFVGSID